jgi:hypothetical protein
MIGFQGLPALAVPLLVKYFPAKAVAPRVGWKTQSSLITHLKAVQLSLLWELNNLNFYTKNVSDI